jgi:putative methionine-R-sulfoxide reductase with GAF domain
MNGTGTLLSALARCARSTAVRSIKAQEVVNTIRRHRSYRWVGLYDVDLRAGLVRVIAWSGPSPPAHTQFPISSGLTARAIRTRNTVNVGDVAADPEYLVALQSTRSEIIVPVLDSTGEAAGTIDVESDRANAFTAEEQELLERSAVVLAPLWNC